MLSRAGFGHFEYVAKTFDVFGDATGSAPGSNWESLEKEDM